MAADRGSHDDSKNHMMSPKGGSEKKASANLEIGCTVSQASAVALDHHGLPVVPQSSCFKDDLLYDHQKLSTSKNGYMFKIHSFFRYCAHNSN
ncbi:hypothetical protein ABEW05_010413 [Botrytis cinerea]